MLHIASPYDYRLFRDPHISSNLPFLLLPYNDSRKRFCSAPFAEQNPLDARVSPVLGFEIALLLDAFPIKTQPM